MGATASTSASPRGHGHPLPGPVKSVIPQDHANAVKVLLPIYYTSSPLLPHEKDKVIKSWKAITSGQAPEFWRLKKEDPVNVPCTSPSMFVGQRFVNRFMEVHPAARGMYSTDPIKQGPMFYRIIAYIVQSLDDSDDNFASRYNALASSHNKMGVRAVEYGIFGECIFYVLRLTLGGEIYDSITHLGWVKVLSRILSIIVPIAVKHEIENEETLHVSMDRRFAPKESSSANIDTDDEAQKRMHEGVYEAQRAAREVALMAPRRKHH